MVLDLRGTATYANGSVVRTELAGVAYVASNPSVATEVRIVTVSDGTYVWQQTVGSPGARPTVTRGSVDRASKYAGIISIVADLAENYDLEVIGRAGGRVSLAGEAIDVPYPAQVVLDESSATPIEIRLGSDSHAISIEIYSCTPLSETDPELFTYRPPEGVEVQILERLANE